MGDALPTLLPSSALPQASTSTWTPTKYLQDPQPAPLEDNKFNEAVFAAARQLLDGKVLKKTRPRRTVDYMGGLGRWALHKKLRPNNKYVPYLRPALPYIIDLFPPKSYPNNPSVSLCTKFVHTSTNKIRCPVNCISWTPEGRRVLTGSTSGEFTLWNGLTFNFETILQAHDTAIRAMTFNHAGTYLASADQTGIIKYFQPNMNNLTAWNGHREAVRGLTFSPDDRRFATCSDDSTVRLWDFEESREERVLTGHGWDVRCVEWHSTKGLLVSGSKDNLVKFWDPRTGTCLSTLHQHKNTIQALAWSPSGDLVASASRDQTIRLFDIRAMKEYRVLKGHKKEVCSVAWHPIHPILVSGGSEGSLLHWDIHAPEHQPGSPQPWGPRAVLQEAHDSNVWALAFHPLGHLLVSGSNDHTTRFWSRDRPGDVGTVFGGGGEKPPEAVDGGGQDEEEDAMLPGLSFMGGGGPGGQWWGKEEDGGSALPGLMGEGHGPMDGRGMFGGGPGGPGGMHDAEDGIPGFGGGPGPGHDSLPNLGGGLRQNGPMPSQNDMFGGSGGGDWNRGGPSGEHRERRRWGPRRGGRH